MIFIFYGTLLSQVSALKTSNFLRNLASLSQQKPHDTETDSAAECNLKLMKNYIYVAGLCYLFILPCELADTIHCITGSCIP